MWSVEQALERILAQVEPLPAERVSLLEALGRVLAEDVIADINVPPFTNSAVDGYAVQAKDTTSATLESPVLLQTLSEVMAGTLAEETITPRTAARIMTGAPVPAGADAIVMVEDIRLSEAGTVAILEAATPGQHLRYVGEDIQLGEVVLQAGTFLRPAEIGMLATMGRATVATIRPARVAVLSTGDEVVDIEEGVVPPPGKIRNSNRYALAALVQEVGATLHSLTHVPDEPEATEIALAACSGLPHPSSKDSSPKVGGQGGEGSEGDIRSSTPADVIVTAGGVSVGDRDFVKPALEKLGTLDLWKVAMKPGKPLAFGRIGETLFFGLPGNPVSAMVTFELFVRPALWKLAGRKESDLARKEVQAVLQENVSHVPGRREYVRAITITQNGQFVTRPTGAQGSGILHSMVRANSLLILPEESLGLTAGTSVAVLLLE